MVKLLLLALLLGMLMACRSGSNITEPCHLSRPPVIGGGVDTAAVDSTGGCQ